MRIIIAKDYEDMSKKAANIVASQMILKPDSILGLATGSTPIGMYKELVRLNKTGDIDFENTTTFNLDEYYGLTKDNDQSYYHFMNENLFNHVNIDKTSTNIPNGMATDVQKECDGYEVRIEQAGGVDIQVLGIGANGHIGFNEPDVKFEAKTHLVKLDQNTIEANSRFFSSIEEVPTTAISMGIKTIMHAKKIVLLASGSGKAEAIYNTVKGNIKPDMPASVLQLHPDVTLIIDEAAATKL